MNTTVIIIIVIVIIVSLIFNSKIENFANYTNVNNQSTYRLATNNITSKIGHLKILLENKILKEDHYMDFLQNLNDSFNNELTKLNGNNTSQSPFKQKALCNPNTNKKVLSKALTDAFNKESNDFNKVQLATINQLISKDPAIFKSQIDNDVCVRKADTLCQRTNPFNYINNAKNTFPPRWLGPYKNVELPKETDPNCWNQMYSCCIKKF